MDQEDHVEAALRAVLGAQGRVGGVPTGREDGVERRAFLVAAQTPRDGR